MTSTVATRLAVADAARRPRAADGALAGIHAPSAFKHAPTVGDVVHGSALGFGTAVGVRLLVGVAAVALLVRSRRTS